MSVEVKRLAEPYILTSQVCDIKECGSIIEVRYMTRKNDKATILKIDKDRYVELSTGEIHNFVHHSDRTGNKSALYHTFENIRDTINCNVVDVTQAHWCTLTYAENMTDYRQLYVDFDKFWKRYKYYLKTMGYDNLEYISVVEPQKRGAWHCHLIILYGKTAPYIPNVKFNEIWGHGFVRIGKLQNVDNVGAYLTAYLADVEIPYTDGMKEGRNLHIVETDGNKPKAIVKGGRLHMYPSGMQIMRCSKGLKKPVKYKKSYRDIKKKVGSAKPTFSKTLELTDSESNFQTVIHKEYYNLNRLCDRNSYQSS